MDIETINGLALLRLHDIIGCKKRKIPPIIPMSRVNWYKGIKDKRYPQPLKTVGNTHLWKASDINEFIRNVK